MSEVVQVEQDDSLYWAAGSEFVQVLVDGLNNSLKKNGVADAKQRQGVCSNFAFGIGNFLDQYWMEVGGQKLYPVLCFTNEFLDIGVPVTDVEPLYLPVKDFEFHGAASDVAEEYFGNQGEQLSIRVGSVGEE